MIYYWLQFSLLLNPKLNIIFNSITNKCTSNFDEFPKHKEDKKAPRRKTKGIRFFGVYLLYNVKI